MSAVYKDESLECAQLACAAYQCYDALDCALPPPLEAVYKISNAKTDTQGFVSLDKTRGIAYVAFKGSWELADFMNDADLFLGAFIDNPQLKAQFKMVECWKSVKDPLIELLLKYLKGASSPPPLSTRLAQLALRPRVSRSCVRSLLQTRRSPRSRSRATAWARRWRA
jgi:hypothetical protein